VLKIQFDAYRNTPEKKNIVEIMEAKPYDLSYLLQITKNDELIIILKQLIQNLHAEIGMMELAIKKNDWTELKKMTHNLKGTVGVLKANEIILSLVAMEDSIKHFNLEIVQSEMVKVIMLSAEITQQLKKEYALLNTIISVA
jgi:HPt (histidine-containing phosphotransfer) domain-containing protein